MGIVREYIDCEPRQLKEMSEYVSPEHYDAQIDGVESTFTIANAFTYDACNEEVFSCIFFNRSSGLKWSINVSVGLLQRLLHQMVRDTGHHDCSYGFYRNERVPSTDSKVIRDYAFDRLGQGAK